MRIGKCEDCGRKVYLEMNNMCLKCLRESECTEPFICLYLDVCSLDSDMISNQMDIAMENHPRIFHSKNHSAEDKDMDLDIGDDFITTYISNSNIKSKYRYDEYTGDSKAERLRKALEDAYKDIKRELTEEFVN